MAFQVPHSTSLGVRAEISALQKRGEQIRKLIPPACYCSNHLNSPDSQMCCLANFLLKKNLYIAGMSTSFWGQKYSMLPKQMQTTIFNRKYIFKWWISHCYVSLPETSLGNSPHLIPPNMVSITFLPHPAKKNIMH